MTECANLCKSKRMPGSVWIKDGARSFCSDSCRQLYGVYRQALESNCMDEVRNAIQHVASGVLRAFLKDRLRQLADGKS